MYDATDKLIAWQKAHKLVLKVYEITKDFPKEEQFGLTSQLQRAAVSVPCNIIEGKARGSNREYRRFLLTARGSLEELKYHILLARDLNYINNNTYENTIELAKEVGRLLNGLITSVSK